MGKVLMAVDHTAGSRAALTVYKSLLPLPECVVLVHVRQPGRTPAISDMSGGTSKVPQESQRDRARAAVPDRNAEKIVGFYKQEIEKIGPVRVKALVRDGFPGDEILKVAEEEKADLIIMGRNGRSGFSWGAAGGIATAVEQSATVPVLAAMTDGRKNLLSMVGGGAYASQ